MDRSNLSTAFQPSVGTPPVAWLVSDGLVDYEAALAVMENRVADIAADRAPECVWLLQHPPIYTAGTSARDGDLAVPRFPVFRTGRGGQYTYHGPGQRIAYVMLDLKRRTPDVRAFVAALESWIITTLATYGIVGERREDRVGVWVRRPEKRSLFGAEPEDKVAALGIRLRHWISFHGVAINVAPDLSHFSGITACGITDPRCGLTSLADLGVSTEMAAFDTALRASFERLFGSTVDAPLALDPSRLP